MTPLRIFFLAPLVLPLLLLLGCARPGYDPMELQDRVKALERVERRRELEAEAPICYKSSWYFKEDNSAYQSSDEIPCPQ